MRKITFRQHEDSGAYDAHDVRMRNAFGYLALWAAHSEQYCNCDVWCDCEGSLHATYSNAAKETTYTIFGLRSEAGDYSYHS